VSFTEKSYLVRITKAAVFTNYLGIKQTLAAIPEGLDVTIDLEGTRLVDHTVMENLEHFKHDYEINGGTVELVGLDDHTAVSSHQLAARKKKGTVVLA
jgi:MFS superfamily sulfate permease-like transporter